MINIQFNGESFSLVERTSLNALIVQHYNHQRPLAAIVNGILITPSDWQTHYLMPNDQVQIIEPAFGG